MSLLPYLLDRRRALEQLCFNDNDILTALMPQMSRGLHPNNMSGDDLPWRSREGSIKSDKNMYQINLDVHHFAPEEVSVKTVDGFVVVEGQHEERRDEHGWVSRRFTRRYSLPEGCNVEAVQSKLSSDGVLTVVAPLEVKANERVVPIVHTGPVRKESQEKNLVP